MKKNILVHIPLCLGDMICFIPLLQKWKSEGKKIILFQYEEKYLNINVNKNEMLNFYEKNHLYDEIFTIPYSKFKLIKIILKNFRKFDIFYAATKTKVNLFFGKILAKKFVYLFNSLNDNTKYDNYIEGMLNKNVNLYDYSNNVSIPYNPDYKRKYNIPNKFVTIFVGPFLRSMFSSERNKLFTHLSGEGYNIILLGSSSENREGWIQKHLSKNSNIINLLGKTNFEEVCSIIRDANFTISANGGIMRLSHFLNKNSISFSTCSGTITHPPVNDKTSFHLINELCDVPCEGSITEDEYNENGCKGCRFYKAENECCCKKYITAEKIINIIKKNF